MAVPGPVKTYNATSDYDVYLYRAGMWHNLPHCKILSDRDCRLAAVKERFTVPYPEQLQKIL